MPDRAELLRRLRIGADSDQLADELGCVRQRRRRRRVGRAGRTVRGDRHPDRTPRHGALRVGKRL